MGCQQQANPVGNSSSGSVSNLAVQNLSGPYITNTHGNGVSCQGATLSITPFATLQDSWKEPYEDSYLDPVFDNSDTNNDGIIRQSWDLYFITSLLEQGRKLIIVLDGASV